MQEEVTLSVGVTVVETPRGPGTAGIAAPATLGALSLWPGLVQLSRGTEQAEDRLLAVMFMERQGGAIT